MITRIYWVYEKTSGDITIEGIRAEIYGCSQARCQNEPKFSPLQEWQACLLGWPPTVATGRRCPGLRQLLKKLEN